MHHHVRSGIAILVALGFFGISWLAGHRAESWEYVFFMFVVFSSALQDAMDKMHRQLEELSQSVKELAGEAQYLKYEIRQAEENLKCHVTAQAQLTMCDIALSTALEKGATGLPEQPSHPEPKFMWPEQPEIKTFDKEEWIAEKIPSVAKALRDGGWWDMSVATWPFRRLFGFVASRASFIGWIAKD